jgi:hypothetical protein
MLKEIKKDLGHYVTITFYKYFSAGGNDFQDWQLCIYRTTKDTAFLWAPDSPIVTSHDVSSHSSLQEH